MITMPSSRRRLYRVPDVTLIILMDIQELLRGLDQHKGSFPKDLVAEVITRQEEVTPRFLEILEDIDKNPEPWLADDGRMIHIYALYGLALFRETTPIRCWCASSPFRVSFRLS